MLESLSSDKKELSKSQEKMLDKLCESVICSTKKEKWTETLISCVNDFNVIETLGTLNDILEISEKHKLEIYPSAILYHSNEA